MLRAFSYEPNLTVIMHIGYVIWSLGLGGAEQVVIRLARAAAARGNRVSVFTLNAPGPFAGELTERGISVVPMGKRGALDLGIVTRLKHAFLKAGVDVVHTHLWGANVWGRLAADAAGLPVVVTEHNVDVWKKAHHFAMDRWLEPRADALIAVSQEVRQFYATRGVGAGRWQVIYNGIEGSAVPEESRRRARADLGIGPHERVVGLVGRLVPAKAPLVFLEAIALAAGRVPGIKALVVGDGPLRCAVEDFIRTRGLSGRVVLTGVRQDVPELLSGMDALAFSSEREGLSMAMLEGMAAGVPVVATRVGGTPELIEHDRTGLLVEPGRPNELAQAIVRVITDQGKAASLRSAAFARVSERFSLRAMIDAHETVYRELAAAFGRRRRDDPRKVCLVIDHLGMGGAQRQMTELTKRLTAPEYRPVVVSLSTEKTTFVSDLRGAGVPVLCIDQRGAVDWSCLKRLTRCLKRMRPDIVHTWLFTADTYGRIAARRSRIRNVICAVRSTIDDMPWHHRIINRCLAPGTARVTVNVEASRMGLIRACGLAPERVRTIHNGLSTDASPACESPGDWPVPAGSPVVGMVARLSAEKDHATLLKAAQRVRRTHPGAVWVLIGDGAMRGSIEREVQTSGLKECVRLLGERRDARALLERMNICVLSTHYEGCSNVIMEAMAAGKPVVATAVGGNGELIVDGITGLLVPHRDADALAGAVARLLNDPALARRMGEQGRLRVREVFSMEASAGKTRALYEEVLNEGVPR